MICPQHANGQCVIGSDRAFPGSGFPRSQNTIPRTPRFSTIACVAYDQSPTADCTCNWSYTAGLVPLERGLKSGLSRRHFGSVRNTPRNNSMVLVNTVERQFKQNLILTILLSTRYISCRLLRCAVSVGEQLVCSSNVRRTAEYTKHREEF
jgi:hypothetical protein